MAWLRVEWLLIPGFLFASGCILPVAATETITRPAASSNPRFAEIITAPGQRVPLNETATPRVAESPPAPNPSHSNRATLQEPPAGAVQPPDVSSAPPFPTTQTSAVSPLLSSEPGIRSASDGPLISALRSYMQDRPEDSREHLLTFNKANQDLLQMLLPAVAAARHVDLTGRDQQQTGQITKQLTSALEMVADASPLSIRKAVFVSGVRQFGDFDPLPPEYRFLPRGKLALMYVELDNAPSMPTPLPTGGSGYVTRLEGVARIRDAAGRVVEQPDRTPGKNVPFVRFEWKEYTRSPLKDVYGTYEFPLPSRPGKYWITLEIRDPATGRAANMTVSFVVDG